MSRFRGAVRPAAPEEIDLVSLNDGIIERRGPDVRIPATVEHPKWLGWLLLSHVTVAYERAYITILSGDVSFTAGSWQINAWLDSDPV